MCERRRAALEEVAREIGECRRCPLHAVRTQAVPGEGDPCAGIMFVGEAPGYNEDLQGRPFVGAAGSLLNELLSLAGLERKAVFITNVVKCRPPNNRDPKDEEVEACKPTLLRQFEVVEPRVLVCLGRHSSKLFFEVAGLSLTSIMRERGNVRRLRVGGREVICLVTLHPAAALYNPQLRQLIESDFQLLRSVLAAVNSGGLGRWMNV